MFPEATESLAGREAGAPLVRREGLLLGTRMEPLLSLTCSYATTPRRHWLEVLGSIRALGFRMVDVPMVWEQHALVEESCDFGQLDPQLDVIEFLHLAHRVGLLVCIRPGPRQKNTAALAQGGIAEYVSSMSASRFEPAESLPASVLGEPAQDFEPSLASRSYLEEAERWLQTVGSLLEPVSYPRGPVVAVHLDAHASLVKYEAGQGDHHSDARALFRDFVKRRYDRPSVLRAAYREEGLGFSQIAPPLEAEPPPNSGLQRQLDWLGFQRRLAEQALQRFATAIRQRCPALPVTVPDFEDRSRLQLRVLDASFRGAPRVRRWSSLSSGSSFDHAGGRLPIVELDLSEGTRVETPERLLSRALACLAAGARGFCLDPGCETPGQPASVLRHNGDPTAFAGTFAPLLAALERTQFHHLRLEPCVQLVVPEELLELGGALRAQAEQSRPWLDASSILTEARNTKQERAPAQRQLREVRKFLQALEAVLVQLGVPFRYAHEWELDQALETAPWTVVVTGEQPSPELLETLSYARRRGVFFSVGPGLPPTLSPNFAGFEAMKLEAEQLVLQRHIQELIQRRQLPRHESAAGPARILFHLRHDDADGPTQAVAFVLNPTSKAIETELACPGFQAKDALTLQPVRSFAERLQVSVAAESVRMLELFKA